MDRIATFHVVRERPGRQVLVMARMLTDRWRLRGVDGLDFAKVLGTGRGEDTGPSADLLRQAYFLVWNDAGAADRFLAGHPVARRWQRLTVEHGLRLRLVAGHGTWSGVDVLAGMRPAAPWGEIVVVTRARLRLRAWWSFRRVSRATAEQLREASGCRWVLGFGELPVGLLGTISCWVTAEHLDAWVRSGGAHGSAMADGPGWFAESLFARFDPTPLR